MRCLFAGTAAAGTYDTGGVLGQPGFNLDCTQGKRRAAFTFGTNFKNFSFMGGNGAGLKLVPNSGASGYVLTDDDELASTGYSHYRNNFGKNCFKAGK